MTKKKIEIAVDLDEKKVPQSIVWQAEGQASGQVSARAMLLSFWDHEQRNTLRLNLWTKEMAVDEMAQFFYQTLMHLADTYKSAVPHSQLCELLRQQARAFMQAFKEEQYTQQ